MEGVRTGQKILLIINGTFSVEKSGMFFRIKTEIIAFSSS